MKWCGFSRFLKGEAWSRPAKEARKGRGRSTSEKPSGRVIVVKQAWGGLAITTATEQGWKAESSLVVAAIAFLAAAAFQINRGKQKGRITASVTIFCGWFV